MQAVATKELRSRMRGARAFAVLSVYLLLLSCLVIAVYAFTTNIIEEQARSGGGAPPPLGRILFYAVTVVELLLIAPLAPAFSASSIAGERERQTFDLVMTTPISAASFVLGKLVSNLSYVLLLLFVSIPVQMLALLFGGLTLTEVLLGFWILIVATVFYASVSLFFSSVMRTTTTATIFSYLAVALTLIGALLVFVLVSLLTAGAQGLIFFGPERSPRLWAVYATLLLIALSPLTAGGTTAAALIANEGTWAFRLAEDGSIPGYPHGIWLLNPWIPYTLIYLSLSALLIWVSIRRVRPTRARHPNRPSRPAELPPAPPVPS
ncbi:MAG: ABC transporter permease [Chloroflexota bacterium]|nr:ABC transporter permease [Chloroflexota bacterium]